MRHPTVVASLWFLGTWTLGSVVEGTLGAAVSLTPVIGLAAALIAGLVTLRSDSGTALPST